MLFKTSQRSHGEQLAKHLSNAHDNEKVTIAEMRGFATCDDLSDAFIEIEAISLATRCQKPFYSLSFNPPADHHMTQEAWMDAINRAEALNGLEEQKRELVSRMW